jgi:hypothetical protein
MTVAQDRTMKNFGDYIVYVDESGDHQLTAGNRDYPMFVLAFCIFHVSDYTSKIVPSLENFKFKYFGHDMTILHEREIRKSLPPFEILHDAELRLRFMADLSEVIDASPFTVVASAIKKEPFESSYLSEENPYHVALEFGLERVFLELQSKGQRERKTFIVFEARGKKEDKELELEFRRIMDRSTMEGMHEALDFLSVSKQTNSPGLQIADMVARPIGIHILNPEQPNRAWESIYKKLRKSPSGKSAGWGLKVYP